MSAAKYSPELDGLRGISILAVLVTHYGLGISFGGKFGVTLFFFISGLLITRLLINEFNATKTLDLGLFYIRRMLRLFPTLLLMIIITAIIAVAMGCSLSPLEAFSSLFYFINYYMAFFRVSETNCSAMLDPLWSLSVEEHFYLVYPLVFWAVYKWGKNLLAILGCLVLVALAIRLSTCFFSDLGHLEIDKTNYILTHTRFDSILYGCMVALILDSKHKKKFLSLVSNPWLFFGAIVALYASFKIEHFYFHAAWQYTVQGICISIIIPPLVEETNYRKFAGVLRIKALVLIGKMSYSLYLFHYLSVIVANNYIGPKSLKPEWLAVAIVPGILLALMSYYFIEKKLVPLRRKFGSSM